MLLEDFNTATPAEVAGALRPCLDIDRWVGEIIAARPFGSVAELLERARSVAAPFTFEEVTAAMAHHPRIGERAAGTSTEADLSRKEQAGVDPGDTAVIEALAAGNRRYEEKFNQVFLIRAAGRSPQEIIQALNQRMKNTAAQESLLVAEQLREIAVLRLEGVMSA